MLGAAGYGKTSVLMQTAYDISKDKELIVLWARQYTEFNSISIAEFCAFIRKPVIIFIDDGPKYMAAIRKLHFDAVSNKFQLYIIVSARPSEWNSARGTSSLSILSTWRLTRLSESEIRNLSIALKRSGLLKDQNENLSVDEIQEHFINIGENHIIAGLRTILYGIDTKFNEIIADEYYRIQNETARRIYLSVALSHSLGIFMPASLASRLSGFPIIDYHTKIEQYLEDIVLEDSDKISGDLLFFTQHRVIAESLLDSVADPVSIVELLQRLSKSINPHSSNEYRLLTRIYDEDYLGATLKENGRIRSFYKFLMEEFPADPYVKQHAAIFESKDKNFDVARNLADEAIKLGDRHPHFLNTKGTIWLREAIDESKPDRAEYALKKGVSLIRERISKDADKEIHYHSLIDKLLDWAIKKPHLSTEQRLRAFEEAQADLDNALRLYPMSSELSTLMGRLNIEIEKIPEAEDRLRRSIYLDAGNVRAILLLANLLLKKGEEINALSYLNEGISYAPKSSGLLRLKLKCLIRLNKSWDEQKKVYLEYLRLAQDDYRKRIFFIKGLIEHGDYIVAERQIKFIKDSNLSFRDRLNLKADLNSENGSPMAVTGTYMSYRFGKGFVNIQGFPKNLDAHLQLSTITNRNYPRDGETLKAEIAVNGLGIFVKKLI